MKINVSDIAVQKRGQLRLRQGTHLGRMDIAIFEQHQCRYATDTKFRWCAGILIDIEFGDLELAGVFLGDFIENGRNHFARPAPFCPVIQEHGLVGFQYFLLKSFISHMGYVVVHTRYLQIIG